jgi:hypothetical protein
MRIPVRGSGWSGRVLMKPSLAAVVVLALSGCAVDSLHLHRSPSRGDRLEYLIRALAADPSARESMWQGVVREEPSDAASLRHALMRTVPGHSGYDLAAAETELQGLVSQQSGDIATVARARLEDLRAANACRHEVDGLKRRLSKVADIEKRLDKERR